MKHGILRRLVPILCFAFAFVALIGLGTWQLQRLQWKTALIAHQATQSALPELSLTELKTLQGAGVSPTEIEHRRLHLSGELLQEKTCFYATSFQGKSGWLLLTPLVHDSQSIVFVNQGFIPFALRENLELQTEKVTLRGILRLLPTQKPHWTVPDNVPETHTCYWPERAALRAVAKIPPSISILEFLVDVEERRPSSPRLVQTGSVYQQIRNPHLSYALTWYGLALALLVVFSVASFKGRLTSSE